MYDGYVAGVIYLQIMRDSIQQLVVPVVTFPLRTGTIAVNVLFCLFSSLETFLLPVS